MSDSKSSSNKNTTVKVKENPVEKVRLDHTILSKNIQDIRDRLDYYVVGQEAAKNALCDALARTIIDNPKRTKPIGTFMFLGPSGVGKTELVKALFRILYGDDDISLGSSKLNCNTVKEGHAVSELIGPPVGYAGELKVPILADTIIFKHFRENQYSDKLHPLIKNFGDFGIFLLDEIEKAHPNLFDMFLNITDDGQIELRTGNTKTSKTEGMFHSKFTNFRNVLIIMTSNLGAKELSDEVSGSGQMGFKDLDNNSRVTVPREFYRKKLENFFSPEFYKRLNDFIPFDFLTKEEYYKVLDMQIEKHNEFYSDFGVQLELSKELSKSLVESAVAKNEGARTLVIHFEDEIVTNFARVLNNEQISSKEGKYNRDINILRIDLDDGGKITVDGVFDVSVERHRKKLKKQYIKDSRKLLSDEAVVSLKEGSMILTLKENIIPSTSYLKALYMNNDEESAFIKTEIEALELQLKNWGFTSTDFESLKMQAVIQEFDDFHLDTQDVCLWKDGKFDSSFNGNLKFIKKYIKSYAEDKHKAKQLLNATSLEEVILPIVVVVSDILSRDMTTEEENVVRMIFHNEFVHLQAKNVPVVPNTGIKSRLEKYRESKKTDTKAESEKNSIVVNINIYGDENTSKGKLKKLFGDDFENMLSLMKQKLSKITKILK